MSCCRLHSTFVFLFLPAVALSAEPLVPQVDREAVLQLRTNGATAAVTALAFSPDATKLYVGGYDKVVHVWTRNDQGDFVADPQRPFYRVPIGPGMDGIINALALSPDGRWLAVAGSGLVRESAGFHENGIVEPRAGRLTDAMLQDLGTIYLFDTRRDTVQVLRGHRGPVLSLSFANPGMKNASLLLSLAREEKADSHVGVARLWDVAKAELLASSPPLPDPKAKRPGLAGWSTAADARALCVAVACEGEPLRVWDVASNRLQAASKQAFWNDTAAFVERPGLAGRGSLYTARALGAEADLQTWTVTGADLDADSARRTVLPDKSLPRGLALLAGPKRAPDLAAVVLVYPLEEETHRLQLVDLTREQFGQQKALVPLWKGRPALGLVPGLDRGRRVINSRPPVIASSADGAHLALAGNAEHEILVYRRVDLLAGKETPNQRLQSPGVSVQQVGFVRKGGARGLLLNERAGTELRPGAFVFDVNQRRLSDNLTGWREDSPAPGWKAVPLELDVKGRAGFALEFEGTSTGPQIRLPAGQIPTAVALWPRPALKEPLLAIAFDEGGVSYLGLYDARGVEIRQYTGHLNPIRSLAFDRAGRLLVSAAEDRTVRVWSLTDLDQTLGQHGLLRGFALKRVGDQLQVAQIHSDLLNGENAQALRAARVSMDGVVKGIVQDGQLTAFKLPHDFYQTIWQRRPGQKVVVRIGERDVPLVVDQGIDERKPLFSLFLTAADNVPERRWVGWNPHGPYEASDRQGAGQYVGWHLNTGKTEAPTSFTLLGDYQKDLYRENILRYLLERGSLAEALQDWKREPVPRPGMTLRLESDEPVRADREGRPLVQRPGTLHADVCGISLSKIERVQWQFDDAPPRAFDQIRGGDYSADLARLNWKRDPHTLQLLVTTIDGEIHREPLRLRYLPPPPTIGFDPSWLKKTFGDKAGEPGAVLRADVREEVFTVEAVVRPALPNQPVTVAVGPSNEGPNVDGLTIRKSITLKPGVNLLTISAVNRGALQGMAEYESDSRQMEIRYVPKVVVPPQVILTSLEVAGREVPLGPDLKRDVDRGEVRIRGRITAPEAVTEATLNRKGLTGFKDVADKRDFRINEVLALKAGENAFVFGARVGKTEAVPRTLSLYYRPELPELTLTAPDARPRRDEERQNVELEGRLKNPADSHPYKVEVFLDGKEIPSELREDRLRARLDLNPGINKIRVALSNEWGNRRQIDREIYCRRVPRILTLTQPARDKAVVDVVATVESPGDLPLLGGQLFVENAAGRNERELDKLQLTPGPNPNSWTVTVKGVSLQQGENTLTLNVRNADGDSLMPEVIKVTYQKPLPPRPTVELVDRAREETVNAPDHTFEVRVRSAEALQPLVVRVEGKEVSGAAQQKQQADHSVVYAVAVKLQPGANVLEIVAANEGGETVLKRTVTYKRPAATLVLDGLEYEHPRERPLRLHKETMPVPTGNAWLHGHVAWPDDDPLLRQPDVQVRVWVNDFEQFDTLLEAPKGRARAFRAAIRLNRQKGNHVELQLRPEIPLEEDQRRSFRVDCLEPEKNQRINLMIVAPGRTDQQQERTRVLAAFLARNIQGDQFETPAFLAGRLYGQFEPDLTNADVRGTLIEMRSGIKKTAEKINDVVVVYFQGEEAVDANGRRYLMTVKSKRTGRLEGQAIDYDEVRERLSEVPGAKILLLDVRPAHAAAVPAPANDFPRLGVFRYVWLGGAVQDKERFIQDLEKSLTHNAFLKDVKAELKTHIAKLGDKADLRLDNPEGHNQVPVGNVPR
jgi:WD40 repeat protein